MIKSPIIGHRGAAGLALENTMASFQKAIEVGVRIFEFDVRATADGAFVICHDDDLSRVSNSSASIKSLTFAKLQKIRLYNGERVPLLKEVLNLARKHQIAVIVEVKIDADLESLCTLLDKYDDLQMTVASFKHQAIIAMKKMRPQYRYYFAEDYHPIAVLRKARSYGISGADINHKVMNPLVYLLAKHWKLEIMIFTVNPRMVGRLMQILYPGVAICTNYPDRFISIKGA